MRYVPSGLHEIVPPNSFARNVTWWRSPPAAGLTYTLLNPFAARSTYASQRLSGDHATAPSAVNGARLNVPRAMRRSRLVLRSITRSCVPPRWNATDLPSGEKIGVTSPDAA